MDLTKEVVYPKEKGWETMMVRIENLRPSKIFVILDENTKVHCLPILKKKIAKDLQIITIGAGEDHKNISTCVQVWKELSKEGADRHSLIINLGGGVVTDLGGFVASTFKRGLRFINIPTTLLAMVDASIGGKNGVDLDYLKNQIGTITSPELVVVESDFLETLPREQVISGVAEMLKHSLIKGETSWKKIKTLDLNDKVTLEELIWESVEIKRQIVSTDPFEANVRKTLNFGHTLGHAIESYCLQQRERKSLLHGEAIAIGMILAVYISNQVLGFPVTKMADVRDGILSIFPKRNFSKNEIDSILKLLIFDKKSSHGVVQFVLIEDFGILRTDCTVSNQLIYNAFKFYENS